MRVFQINCDCGCYSTGRIVSDIATLLEKNGDESLVAYGRDYRYTGIKAVRIGTKIGVYLHAILARLTDSCGLHSVLATKKLIRLIIQYSPDIIHLHNLHGYYVNYPVLFRFLKKYKKPIIWTMHDCWAFTGHCSHFEYAKCSLWKNLCYKCCQKKEYPRAIFSFCRRNYELKKDSFSNVPNMTIVTPSNWLKKQLSESFLKKYPVVVINNGINTNVFHKSTSNYFSTKEFRNKKIILGVASKWTAKKGINDFVRLSYLINHNEYAIVLVGLSEKEIKKMPASIYCIEKTHDSKELAGIYSSAYVLFNPTYEDTYPTVNLEAQSCQIPVVTYKTGGSGESVPRKQIIEKGDLLTFLSILNDKQLTFTTKVKSEKEMVDDYVALYKRVLKNDYGKC